MRLAKLRKCVGAIAEHAGGSVSSRTASRTKRSLPVCIDLAAHEIFPCLPLVNQRELVAANQRLGRQRPRIVVGSHHKPVRARAHNREQIALVQFRHFPIQRKEITRLAHRPDNVDLFNPLPLSLTLTRTRIPALTLAHSFTLTWRFASASRDRDRAER